jgi:hypothetical protein
MAFSCSVGIDYCGGTVEVGAAAATGVGSAGVCAVLGVASVLAAGLAVSVPSTAGFAASVFDVSVVCTSCFSASFFSATVFPWSGLTVSIFTVDKIVCRRAKTLSRSMCLSDASACAALVVTLSANS